MSSPQQTSDQDQNILQHIQQEIEGLKTKLYIKDTRLEKLGTDLKDTQAEIESTQTNLETTQSELNATQSELKSTQSQLATTQSELKSTQSQLATTRQELKVTREYTNNILIGTVVAFAMSSPPQGWLECNGQVVSRTTYARLYQRIGTQFGKGDGYRTFNWRRFKTKKSGLTNYANHRDW